MDEIIHKTGKRKFSIEGNGLKATLKYKIRKDMIMDILHTEVPDAWRGKGIGKRLVDAALEFAKQENYSVKASCSFVQKNLQLTSES